MSNPEINRFPSRMFVRFIAHKQLIADATGMITTLQAQRRGKPAFFQQFLPGDRVPTETIDWSDLIAAAEAEPANIAAADDNHDQSPPISTVAPRRETLGGVDEELFADIVKTTMTPQNWPTLYTAAETPTAATDCELAAAREIVLAYRRIKANQDRAVVQGLNKLL